MVQPQLCGALIATLSYSDFEIIQLQRIESATKSNVIRAELMMAT